MAPLPARGPAVERWWEREIDRRVARAVGLSDDLSNETIARHFRSLLGLSPEGTVDPLLWPRFLYGIELALTGPLGPRGDRAEFANNVVEWAAPGFGEPDEERFDYGVWDRELGVTGARSDDVLRHLAYDEIATRLERAGLYAIL